MNKVKTIKQLFTPIQPTIKNSDGNVNYIEVPPDEKLSEYIYCYWQLKTKQKLTDDFIYRIVSDGCIDILWECGAPDTNFVSGFSNTYTEFALGDAFNYLGIRFLPTAFPVLFKVAASELTNRFEELQLVLPLLSAQLAKFTEGQESIHHLKPVLDSLFLKAVMQADSNLDARIFNALDVILKSKGTLSIERDLDIGLSPRQLRRLFQFYIGDSPKSFCKIVRFQNILIAKPSIESLKKNKIFYDLGYFDQAHFIKEFKHLFGDTPTTALK